MAGAADLGLAFLRLAGLGLAYHGWRKVFGSDMPATVEHIKTVGLPVPAAFAWTTAIIELAGGTLVTVGFFTRVGAGFAAVTMFGAAFLVHNTALSENRELALAYLVVMLSIACMGAGKWSIDGMFRKSSA
jgi:putative oxidoreductase